MCKIATLRFISLNLILFITITACDRIDSNKKKIISAVKAELSQQQPSYWKALRVSFEDNRLKADVALATKINHAAENSICLRLANVIMPKLKKKHSWQGQLSIEGNVVKNCEPLPAADDRDSDDDKIVNRDDNCPLIANPLQVDMDLDGVGDICDNCPTEANPNQEDSNFDGGGDSCEPPVLFTRCGPSFEPERGIAKSLLQKDASHAKMAGVVHPVIQFSAALMEDERELLAENGVRLSQFLSYNVALAAVPQDRLANLMNLPFVRAAMPLPAECRVGETMDCPGLKDGRWTTPDKEPEKQPSARRGLAITFDHDRNLSVLFGGDAGKEFGLLGDTWEYDGVNWQQRISTRKPPRRRAHALVYLPKLKVSVMFGGLEIDTDTGDIVPSQDTWLWNGNEWNTAPVRPTPSGRYGHTMAYDAARGVIVLYGGIDRTGKVLNDTWTFDGTVWKELSPEKNPDGRADHAMAWDRDSQSIILFGGKRDDKLFDDTWSWNGESWQKLEPGNTPGARYQHAMTSHGSGCGVLLVGGNTEKADLSAESWFYSNDDWVRIQVPRSLEKRSEHSLTYDTKRDRAVVFGGVSEQQRLLASLRKLEPSPIVEVLFHEDVPDAVASDILTSHGARIVTQSVTVSAGRFNSWQAAVPQTEINALSAEDPVVHTQFVGVGVDLNDGSRAAINVVQANQAPFCGGAGCTGNGVVLAQWETRWASGDNNPPPPNPPLPAGAGVHADLSPRITVRDMNPLPAPAAPAGCAANILCNLCTFSNHASHVAGTMLSSGGNNAAMIGMAPNATNISYNGATSVAEQTCEFTDSVQTFGAQIANLSWNGNGGWNCANQAQYDNFSNGVDQQVVGTPAQLIVAAAGNSQKSRGAGCVMPAIYTPTACTAVPAGVTPPPAIAVPAAATRFYTILAGMSQAAKNAFVVGAINSGAPTNAANLGQMTSFSSWGPTRDGRIKPDVVAAGAELDTRDNTVAFCGTAGAPPAPACDPDPMITSTNCNPNSGNCQNIGTGYGALRGTSMATPAVSGGTALLIEQQNITGLIANDTPLDSDSLRALIIHTATDLNVHTGAGGAFMALQGCGGGGANECWPVPAVQPAVVQDGPDYVNGYGLANFLAAAQKINNSNPSVILQPSGCPNNVTLNPMPFNSPLALGGDPSTIGIAGCSTNSVWDWVGYINVPAGTTQLKVTIAWNDPQTAPPVAGATGNLLVNDLDLIVTPGTGMGGSFTPTGPHNYSWWLDPACPHLQAVPVAVNTWSPATYADHRNTVEQVIVNNPAVGQWRIVVQSIGTAGQQPFAIIISMPPTAP